MGNRAVITNDLEGIGVYLHWNGGRDSVEAFLKYCEYKGFRSPEQDPSYAFARLTQIISNYFGGTCSIGIDMCKNLDLDNGDNGVYILKGWSISERKYFSGVEQNEYDLQEMLIDIDKEQPKSQQLGEFLTSETVKTNTLKPGDYVIIQDKVYNVIEKHKVIGIGKDEIINGHNVFGIPYIDKYGEDYSRNSNNYIFDDTSHKAKAPETVKNIKDIDVSINKELNGIELKFSKKPIDMTRQELKSHGFRWHSKKSIWYAKKTPENIDFIKALTGLIIE